MTERATETVTIAAEEAGQRLDRVLAARLPALSRSRLKALILDGQVTIQGTVEARTIRDPNAQVKSGETVTLNLPPPEEPKPAGEAIPLTIIYEDDALNRDRQAARPGRASRRRSQPTARWSTR